MERKSKPQVNIRDYTRIYANRIEVWFFFSAMNYDYFMACGYIDNLHTYRDICIYLYGVLSQYKMMLRWFPIAHQSRNKHLNHIKCIRMPIIKFNFTITKNAYLAYVPTEKITNYGYNSKNKNAVQSTTDSTGVKTLRFHRKYFSLLYEEKKKKSLNCQNYASVSVLVI